MKAVLGALVSIVILGYMIYWPLCANMERRNFVMAMIKNDKGVSARALYKGLKYDPKNTVLLFEAGRFFAQNKEYDIALKYLERAIETYNGDIRIWAIYKWKARIYLARGDQEKAGQELMQVVYYTGKTGGTL